MSIRVYLSSTVTEDGQFRHYPDKRGRVFLFSSKPEFPGTRLYQENDRWHLSIDDTAESVPAALEQYAEGFSFCGNLPCGIIREAGKYACGSAEAEVSQQGSGWTKVEASAKSLEDLRNLLHQLKIGSIRPDESYEGPQTGLSRQELESIVAEAVKDRKCIHDRYIQIAEAQGRIDTLHMELVKKPWWMPLILVRTVRENIRKALVG